MANALLSIEELTRFRTKLCRRSLKDGCDFGPLRCQYSHNVYWPRRCPFYLSDPSALRYLPEICPDITIVDKTTGKVINLCNRGGYCPYSHSIEEVIYHPLLYKKELCTAFQKGECKTYYCHLVHGLAEKRPEKNYTLPFTRGINLKNYPNVVLVAKTSPPGIESFKSNIFNSNKTKVNIEALKDKSDLEKKNFNNSDFFSADSFSSFSKNLHLNSDSKYGEELSTTNVGKSWHDLMKIYCYSRNSELEPFTEIRGLLQKWRHIAECPELYINSLNLVSFDYWRCISNNIKEIKDIVNSLMTIYCIESNIQLGNSKSKDNLQTHVGIECGQKGSLSSLLDGIDLEVYSPISTVNNQDNDKYNLKSGHSSSLIQPQIHY
ncbi:putative zinc finger protein [Cryptosporidium felis]|nr:putative zinc finger protein [Cryptosporidium felis]